MKQVSGSVAQRFVADVDPVVVRHIVAELADRGMNLSPIFNGLGFNEQCLKDADFCVSYAQTSQVVRRAVQLSGDNHFGLYLGATVNLVSWGTCLIGLMACANTREMLSFAADFLPSTGRLLRLRCEDSGEGPRIIAQPRFDEPVVSAFLVEKTFAAIVRACKNIVGCSYGPSRVALAMPMPSSNAAFAKALQCTVTFAQPQNCMQFPPSPVIIATSDAVIVEKVRRQLAAQHSGKSQVHEVESVIVQAFQGCLDAPPTLTEIARTLNLSERTLRRRLEDAELGYAALLDRERRDQALALIRSRQHPLSHVAAATGFADVRSLRRAVKRWTGHAPIAVRDKT